MVKVVILTGGEGSRLQPVTNEINKCAMKLNGKPLIDYSLDICSELVKRRVIEDEVIIVTGYRGSDLWYIHPDYKFKNLKIRYRFQQYPTCIGAIKSVEDLIDDAYFMLMLGDEVFINPRHNAMFTELYDGNYQNKRIDGYIGYVNGKLDDVKKTYSLKSNGLDLIYKLQEKPKEPFNNYVGTGNCILPKDIFKFIPKVKRNNLGAGDFVGIVDDMIHSGYIFKKFKIADDYANINSIDDFKRAEKMISKLK